MLDATSGDAFVRTNSILIFGFQGLRTVHGILCRDLPEKELTEVENTFKSDALIYTGHVGVSFDDGKKIYGFNPRSPSEELNLYEHMLPMLKTHLSFPGVLTDDKKTFTLAQEGHVRHGWNTRVHVITVDVPTPKFNQLKRDCKAMYSGVQTVHPAGCPTETLKYSFPFRKQSKDGSFFQDKCTANCATFPVDILGIPIARWRTTMVQFLRDLHNDKVCSHVCDRASVILLGTEDTITPRRHSIMILAGCRERIASLTAHSLVEATEIEDEVRKSYQLHLEALACALDNVLRLKKVVIESAGYYITECRKFPYNFISVESSYGLEKCLP
ncbi:hypothetical protein SARC_12953 [Sphaeroforma arctica JP610]|uniref:Uncharacterized protein n=1 Tax=Sphaeroforma arctica JP610 TaxID=667725 RepID=A0A0L0FCM7_9EUKA|nr:hypothetical protein SARC_12953 [Sphaeroforma arctica JP610]KNC74504.1 hypothetical protein SARC_12953 [Sphaeroforma arctica JP610]|eukprot:XP_014148406.1 hypothetical protein SARC_12953 [Sphaeroforma arctica JP610]